MPFGDLLERVVLTQTIVRQAGLEAHVGNQLAPQVDHNSMWARLRIDEVRPGGLSQYKAPGAGTPVYNPEHRLSEGLIGLVIMEEMTPFNEKDKLDSPDEDVARNTANSLIDYGVELTNRERRLTEVMRWSGLLSGILSVKYADGFANIDYGYTPGVEIDTLTGNRMWSDAANSRPIDDFRTWHLLMQNKSGSPITECWMNSVTLYYLIQNTQIQSQLGAWNRTYLTPTLQDIQTLLQLSSPITIYDGFYYTDYLSPTRTPVKFLPDGYVLMMGQKQINGINTAEVLNGPMVVVQGNQLVRTQGPTDETFADPLSKTYYIRHGASRMLRINFVEQVMIRKVA